MGVLLELDKVNKSFGGLKVNQNISFTMEKGEILGLIGPNGAGKTTLINLISGNHPADNGKILFQGREIQDLKPNKVNHLGIARTYQVVQPFYGISVRGNVATGALFGRMGSGRKMKDALRHADEIIELCHMSSKKDELVDNLTIADIKRLEIAKAMATDPNLLLLDEAMAGLNPKEIDDSLELIRKINNMGVSLIIVEHIMKAVMSVSNRVVVIHQGQLMSIDTPKAIVKDEKVIKAYLGEKFAARHEKSGGN